MTTSPTAFRRCTDVTRTSQKNARAQKPARDHRFAFKTNRLAPFSHPRERVSSVFDTRRAKKRERKLIFNAPLIFLRTFCAKRFVASNSASRPGSRPQKTRGNSRFGGSYLFSSPFCIYVYVCKASLSLSLSLSLSGGSVRAFVKDTQVTTYDAVKSMTTVELVSFEARRIIRGRSKKKGLVFTNASRMSSSPSEKKKWKKKRTQSVH